MNASMTPLPSNRADGIFIAALDHAAVDREAFLTTACGEDAVLLLEVRALLAAHEAMPTGFLTAPAAYRVAERDVETTIKHDSSTEPLCRVTTPERDGERIGRYKLLQEIGEGGFGTVWMAEQMEPVVRRVALKIIKLGMDTKEVIARFEVERQALAMMDHPNIAKVFDAGATDKGRPFFVMELVKGMPITQYCDEAGLGTRERLALFGDVCAAINHAHQKGVIHRDIKPSNVMVTLYADKPVVKVIDFGIAKATQSKLTDKTLFTRFEQFIGTPVYMSPEQAALSAVDIDTRSDIYALGILLYELLVGKPPFDVKSLLSVGYEEMRRIIREVEPAKPSSRLETIVGEERTQLAKARHIDPAKVGGLVEPDLDWIVMKAIDKDRGRRYETANAFLQDIRRFLSDEAVSATPPSAGYQFRMFARRNKKALRVAMLIGAVLIITTVVSTWAWIDASRARIAEREQRIAFQTEAHRANEAERDAVRLRTESELQELATRRRAYATDMLRGQQAIKDHNLREARQMLEQQRPAKGEIDLRGWEWRHLWKCCQSGAAFELPNQGNRVLTALYATGGKSLVTFESGGKVSLVDVAPGTAPFVLQERETQDPSLLGANSGFLSVSDDGKVAAAVGCKGSDDYCVRVWDVRQRKLMSTMRGDKTVITAIALSPDKASLAAIIASHDEVWIWDIATQQQRQTIPIKRGLNHTICGAICYSHDGSMLAIGETTGRVRLIELETATTRGEFMLTGRVMALAFSMDDRSLAVGSAWIDPFVLIWDVAKKRIVKALGGHEGFITRIAFDPDGQSLASASADQTVRLWRTADWSAGPVLMGHTDEVWSVQFSPDGRQIVSAGKDCRMFLWEEPRGYPRNSGSKVLPLLNHSHLDVSPDGKTFVSISQGVVHLLTDTDTAHEELGTNNVAAFFVAPDEVVLGVKDPPQIKVWNVKDKDAATFPLKSSEGYVRLDYQPASRMVIAMVYDPTTKINTVTRWDVATRRELSSCSVEVGPIDGLSYRISQDGGAMVRSRDGGSAQMLNLATGEMGEPFKVRDGAIQGLALSPDGKTLVSAGRDSPVMDVWDVTSMKQHTSLRGHNLVLLTLGFSPDGQRLMSSSIGTEAIKVWETQSWHQVSALTGRPGVSLSYPRLLSDGNTIAAQELEFSTGRKRMRVWQSASWEEIIAAEAAKTSP